MTAVTVTGKGTDAGSEMDVIVGETNIQFGRV